MFSEAAIGPNMSCLCLYLLFLLFKPEKVQVSGTALPTSNVHGEEPAFKEVKVHPQDLKHT